MESSYRIIKGNYVENSTDDKILIDTSIEDIVKAEEKNIEEEILELNLASEEKLKMIEDLEDYKKRINRQIESERKNILEKSLIDAEKKAIIMREKAYEEGYNEGFSKAIEDAKEEAQEIKNKSLDLLKETKVYRDKYLKENERNIYELAKNMAENIIHYSIDVEDENIINLIRPLLEEYLKEEDITITTTKEGKRLLKKHKKSLENICPNTRFIFLVDKSIEENGFIIENKESIVDLSIRVQLENMVKAISDIDG